MIRTILFAATMICAAAPAMATGGIYCEGARDKDVSAYISLGRVPGFAALNARFTTKDKMWSTSEEPGSIPVEMTQGASFGQMVVADYVDPNYEQILVSLRVVSVSNDIDVAAGGVLSIPGVGVWPVVCEME